MPHSAGHGFGLSMALVYQSSTPIVPRNTTTIKLSLAAMYASVSWISSKGDLRASSPPWDGRGWCESKRHKTNSNKQHQTAR